MIMYMLPNTVQYIFESSEAVRFYLGILNCCIIDFPNY